jgi:hypothetical protein
MNHCALGERATLLVQDLIPIDVLRGRFDATTDDWVRETLLDLGCRYSKVALRPDMALSLIDLCRVALTLGVRGFLQSTFWILVRLLRHSSEAVVYIMCADVLGNANRVFKCRHPGPLIPGMIFTSYVYELGFEYPRLSYRKILDVLSEPPDAATQRQACRTLTKIVVRRPEMIKALVENGLFFHIADGLALAKFRNKVEIALLACDAIELGGRPATNRVVHTKCVNLWVEFIEWEDDELTVRGLQALGRIFEAVEELPEEKARRVHGRFLAVGGVATVEKLMVDENEEIAHLAAEFFESYLAEVGRAEEEEEEGEEGRE